MSNSIVVFAILESIALYNMQVFVTAVVVGLVAHYICGNPTPAAIVIGNGLALSSTAVVLQVKAVSKYFLRGGNVLRSTHTNSHVHIVKS